MLSPIKQKRGQPRSSKVVHVGLCFMFALLIAVTGVAADATQDAEFSYRIRDALRIDPRVDATRIRVSTKDCIVTLSGAVGNLASRKYADLEAQKTVCRIGLELMTAIVDRWPGMRTSESQGNDRQIISCPGTDFASPRSDNGILQKQENESWLSQHI